MQNIQDAPSSQDFSESGGKTLIHFLGDDNKAADELIASLESCGFTVRRFDRADALRSASAQQAPKTILIDYDAHEGTLALNGGAIQHRGEAVPTIAISSNDDFNERLQAVRLGLDGYFLKPVNVPSLVARIDHRIAEHEIHGYRVLAVDDDVDLSQFYEVVLNSVGMHVKTLNEPFQILDQMKRFRPELILMDLHMPHCTGIELAKLIRQNDAYIDIPIVFLSTENAFDRQLDAIRSGGDEFLTKPIDPEKLIHAVTNRAERYRALRQGRYYA